MATLAEIQKQEGWTDDQTVKFMVDNLGYEEQEARFILAIEKGEIDGDVVEVDEDGNEI